MIFASGVSGAFQWGGFGGAFLILAALCILWGIFVFSRPVRMFTNNSLPAWKAFIPFYNMWVIFKEVIDRSALFFAWLLLNIIAAYFLLSAEISGSNSPVGFFVFLASVLPTIELIEDEGFLSWLYAMILMSIGAMIPIAFLIYPFIA